ncbi:TERB2 protein, partial [Spizaetus tyrannus]|nr:TERB2 protein [Spizaetus tyrannus]
MFRGRRAWFSQSVSPGPRELWVAGGGVVTHWRDADYLFSSDAAHPDTRRWAVLCPPAVSPPCWQHPPCLGVACSSPGLAQAATATQCHYLMPSQSFIFLFMAEIRRKIGSFIWEQADDSLAEQRNEKLTDEPEAVRKSCEEEAEEDVLDLAESEEETGSRALPQGEFPYRALQEYPTNNMVTGYTSARDMKKYVGELCDFIPGTSGYAVYWIQNEINIYSDVKTKTKRKF